MPTPQRPATGPVILDAVLQLRSLLESLPSETAAVLQSSAAMSDRLTAIEQQLATISRQLSELPRLLHAADALAVGDLDRRGP